MVLTAAGEVWIDNFKPCPFLRGTFTPTIHTAEGLAYHTDIVLN